MHTLAKKRNGSSSPRWRPSQLRRWYERDYSFSDWSGWHDVPSRRINIRYWATLSINNKCWDTGFAIAGSGTLCHFYTDVVANKSIDVVCVTRPVRTRCNWVSWYVLLYPWNNADERPHYLLQSSCFTIEAASPPLPWLLSSSTTCCMRNRVCLYDTNSPFWLSPFYYRMDG